MIHPHVYSHRASPRKLTRDGPFSGRVLSDKYFPQYLGRDAQDIIGKIFSAYFTVEFCIQVLAKGLFWGPKTYLTDTANWLDAFIVALGIVDFVPSDGEGGSLSSLRALRILRILRAVNKYPQLRDLVILLAKCVAKLVIVVGICAFIFLVFGILGVQLYKGTPAEGPVHAQSLLCSCQRSVPKPSVC